MPDDDLIEDKCSLTYVVLISHIVMRRRLIFHLMNSGREKVPTVLKDTGRIS